MPDTKTIQTIHSQLQTGMEFLKCRRCGCMQETLEALHTPLASLTTEDAGMLLQRVQRWAAQMEPVKYACLGCEHCFPAVAMNDFQQAFPQSESPATLGCAFDINDGDWPPVAGEYHAFCDGPGCPVAVSTLASLDLADKLAQSRPPGLCIVGKTETENIGVDKLIKNILANPTIRVLVLAGTEVKGHRSGSTLRALWENGIDDAMRVIGSPARRPILRNVTPVEVQAVRRQVKVVDMIGCEDEQRVIAAIEDLHGEFQTSCGCERAATAVSTARTADVPTIHAEAPLRVKMDRAGYFVILPQPARETIIVEYYAYDNALSGIIDGRDARSVYWTIIRNGWVTELSHAAYLGKELARAELSIHKGFRYIQDGA